MRLRRVCCRFHVKSAAPLHARGRERTRRRIYINSATSAAAPSKAIHGGPPRRSSEALSVGSEFQSFAGSSFSAPTQTQRISLLPMSCMVPSQLLPLSSLVYTLSTRTAHAYNVFAIPTPWTRFASSPPGCAGQSHPIAPPIAVITMSMRCRSCYVVGSKVGLVMTG